MRVVLLHVPLGLSVLTGLPYPQGASLVNSLRADAGRNITSTVPMPLRQQTRRTLELPEFDAARKLRTVTALRYSLICCVHVNPDTLRAWRPNRDTRDFVLQQRWL